MLSKIARHLKRGSGGSEPARHLRVYMDTNQTCNLACRMCIRSAFSTAPQANKSMEWPLFKKIAREVFPLAEQVSLSCGAEPLHSAIFLKALKYTVKRGVPYVDFVTNGMLLDRKAIAAIIDSGADLMKVSLDSADKATFERLRHGASFDKLIRSLELFKSIKEKRGVTKPALRISAVLMRSTIDGIEELLRLAHKLGAEGVMFQHLVTYRLLHTREESLFNDRALANKRMAEAKALAKELGFKVLNIPEAFDEAAASADTAPNCGLPHSFHIDLAGNITACQASGLFRAPVGNLARQSFAEIWNAPAYAKLREDFAAGRYPEICRKCPAVYSGRSSDREAFEEITPPDLEEISELIMRRAPFSEVVALLRGKPPAFFALVKPDYDIFSDSGDDAEKMKRWEEWYNECLRIQDRLLRENPR